MHTASRSKAGEWMKEVAGSANAYIATVGEHFHSQLGAANLDASYWINPRKNPTSPGVAVGNSISMAVVVFAVSKVDVESGGQRRSRALLQAVGSRPGIDKVMSSGAVRLQVSRQMLVASMLGVSEELVTTWHVSLRIDEAQACLSSEQLRTIARQRLLFALESAASTVREVSIAAISVDTGRVQCAGGRRNSDSQEPRVLVEAFIVFAATDTGSTATRPFINVNKLEAAAGVLSVSQGKVGPLVHVVRSGSAGSDSESTPTHSNIPPANQAANAARVSLLLVIATALAGVGMLLLGALMWYRRARNTHWKQTEAATASTHAVALQDKVRRGEIGVDARLGEVWCLLLAAPRWQQSAKIDELAWASLDSSSEQASGQAGTFAGLI